MMCSVHTRMRRALEMGTSENVTSICRSLQTLGFGYAGDKIYEALMSSADDPLAIVGLALNAAVMTEKNAKYE